MYLFVQAFLLDDQKEGELLFPLLVNRVLLLFIATALPASGGSLRLWARNDEEECVWSDLRRVGVVGLSRAIKDLRKKGYGLQTNVPAEMGECTCARGGGAPLQTVSPPAAAPAAALR